MAKNQALQQDDTFEVVYALYREAQAFSLTQNLMPKQQLLPRQRLLYNRENRATNRYSRPYLHAHLRLK